MPSVYNSSTSCNHASHAAVRIVYNAPAVLNAANPKPVVKMSRV
jgi:hypothetical protein